MNKTKKNKTIILKDKNLSSTEVFQKELTSDYKILAKNKKVKQSDVDNFKYNKEELDSKDIGLNSSYSYLYPNLNDPNFNIKISEKKEFLDTRYDGEIKDAVTQSDILCNAEFEVSPHQLFVRNFMSFQTPYNSLLLYHGLGSGKTCSGISVAEEMRDYLKQLGISQRIIIVASPNVQENFKLQLFDERKLVNIDGLWNMKSCIGNKFLKEINPMNMKGLSRENIITQSIRIINTSYLFIGYIEFANYISKKSQIDGDMSKKVRDTLMKEKLKEFFSNRLIIIDEVHNIRMTDDNKDKNKKVATELHKLITNVSNIRLLLLSATPMYNSYKEIIWLINLMNLNDKRPIIDIHNVFNKDGSFKIDENGKEVGKELLERKATGYVSFVRGENPYTFPYRIWPKLFSEKNSILSDTFVYPNIQLNGNQVLQRLELIDLYMVNTGDYQRKGYKLILNSIKKAAKKANSDEERQNLIPTFENMEGVGYILLQKPIQALNFIYPYDRLDALNDDLEGNIDFDTRSMVGSSGLNRIMKYEETSSPPSKKNFEYKNMQEYGRIFSFDEIGKYSGKIKSICANILNSTGIILIYSEYIDGGLVPIALALEELGFIKHGRRSLFKTPPREAIDSIEFKIKAEIVGRVFQPAKYIMITGDKHYSPDNVSELKALTNRDNNNGEKIKVVLISQAGAEGLDFKNVRQVHILEPWYNMNRIEQIIGRAVRNCSHKDLAFKDRNVNIYLYGTYLNNEDEAADLYIYRLAELKARKIGIVSRVLKELSVDCILHHAQTNFTLENMAQNVEQNLSNNITIDYSIGDRPYTSICDYMEKCTYTCNPNKDNLLSNSDTFTEKFIFINNDKIIQRIRSIFKERHFFTKKELILQINANKEYPIIQINAALTQLIEDKNEYITDEYGRLGNLINIKDMYLFQPLELTNENITTYDRSVPLQYKNKDITFILPETILNKDKYIEEQNIEEVKNIDISDLLIKLETNFKNGITSKKAIKGEDEWYYYYNNASIKLVSGGLATKQTLALFLIDHIIEHLEYSDTFKLLNYLYNPKNNLSSLMKLIKNYYIKHIITDKGVVGLVLHNAEKNPSIQIVVLKNDKWVIGEFTDIKILENKIKQITPKLEDLNNVIGFIGNFKNKYMIFKVKMMNEKRNTGARCDQTGKKDAIKILNIIVNENKYTSENTKGINKNELCIYQELLLRVFNKNKKNNNKWFLNNVESALLNIEKKNI